MKIKNIKGIKSKLYFHLTQNQTHEKQKENKNPQPKSLSILCFEVIKKAHALLTCLKRENSNQLNNVNDGKSRAGCHSTQVGIMVRKIATLYKICMAKTEQNAHIVLSIRTTAVKYRYQCKAIYIIENSPHKFTCMRRK